MKDLITRPSDTWRSMQWLASPVSGMTASTARLLPARGAIDGRVAELCQHDLGGILAGIVDELSVVPVAGSTVPVLDCDARRPRSAAT